MLIPELQTRLSPTLSTDGHETVNGSPGQCVGGSGLQIAVRRPSTHRDFRRIMFNPARYVGSL
jgi:hypothetical protein